MKKILLLRRLPIGLVFHISIQYFQIEMKRFLYRLNTRTYNLNTKK